MRFFKGSKKNEGDHPQGKRFSPRQLQGYRSHTHTRDRDALGILLWILDRAVVVACLLAAAGAGLVIYNELNQPDSNYEDLRTIKSVGQMFVACLNRVWPLLLGAFVAGSLARFIRTVSGRA